MFILSLPGLPEADNGLCNTFSEVVENNAILYCVC